MIPLFHSILTSFALIRELKKQRREIDALKSIQAEVDAQEAEHQAKLARKAAIQREKEMQLPPRLGKQTFTPEPLQVKSNEGMSISLVQQVTGTII